MRRTDEEQLIERYLGGRMSGAQEQEFFIRLAVDSNLRQRFKAYRIIDGAMQKHRDSIPTTHDATRAALIASMSTLPAPAQMPSTMQRLARWIGATSAVAVLAIVAVLIQPSLTNNGRTPQSSLGIPAAAHQSAPLLREPSSMGPAPAESDAPVTLNRGERVSLPEIRLRKEPAVQQRADVRSFSGATHRGIQLDTAVSETPDGRVHNVVLGHPDTNTVPAKSSVRINPPTIRR